MKLNRRHIECQSDECHMRCVVNESVKTSDNMEGNG